MKNRYTVESIKDYIKREDFKIQMKLFLYSKDKEKYNSMLEFPIRYMKFTSIKAGDEKGIKWVPDGNGGLIRKAIDLWNQVFAGGVNNNLPVIARALLWGCFQEPSHHCFNGREHFQDWKIVQYHIAIQE